MGPYAQSAPAENAFATAEDRTTTRTLGSLAMRSKAAPYSRQNLFQFALVTAGETSTPTTE
jgi:hypothetical protein